MSGITCALLRNKKRRQKGKETKQNKNKKQMFLEWAETFLLFATETPVKLFLTLDTKKQQSAPVANPRLLYASLNHLFQGHPTRI